MLWACLLLPSLPLDVFARAASPADAAKPFAVGSGGRTPRIVDANAGARDAGIHPGQFVSASLALSPGLVLRERDPDAESAALAAVASWATQFTPAVALAPPDAVLAEIGGSLRLFGGLPKLIARLSRGAHDLGYATRLALAPTPSAALLFARVEGGVRPGFFPVSAEENEGVRKAGPDPAFLDALAPLPLSLTEADPAAVATLAAAGLTTFGQACALPRAALARRVGADFVAVLDRVRGLVPEPRPPFVPPPGYAGKLDLPAPVASVDALAFAVNRLVLELAGWLTGRGLGVVEMSLALAHERYVRVATGVPATVVGFALAAPAREPAHLVAVLRERLARIVLPAPVEVITLASQATAPLASRNLGLFTGDEAVATVPLLDRLRARLGEGAVMLVAPHAEHRPEHAWREGKVGDRPRFSGTTEGASKTWPVPRPVWLLAEPEPLGHRLEAQPWVLRDGPERIESGWWDGRDVRRDYFVAENPRGETVWIYRDHRCGLGDGEWFLHGIFG
ncbi:MAG: DNA polymerase Y family protein [Betaproteobacteria bacterium]|nr:DNA polymerase Y family protein [Betaproteobacteria bacterium]